MSLAPQTCAKPPVVLPWLGYDMCKDVLLQSQEIKVECANVRGDFKHQFLPPTVSSHLVHSQEWQHKWGESFACSEPVSRGASEDVEAQIHETAVQIDQTKQTPIAAIQPTAKQNEDGPICKGRWRKKGLRLPLARRDSTSTSRASNSNCCAVDVAASTASSSNYCTVDVEHFPTCPTLGIKFLYASPLCSNDAQLPPLNVQSEYGVMLDSLQHCGVSPHVCLDVSVATIETLSRVGTESPKSNARCTWWHLSAHCIMDASGRETGRLVLEDADGGAHAVPATAASLGALRAPFGALVLACGSVAVGRMLLECGAAFVIVAQGRLLDMAACAFTSHFYKVMLAKWPQQTYSHGRREVLPEHESGRPCVQEAAAVRAAFQVAKEALRMSQSKALQTEADKLILLETCRAPALALGAQALVSRSASSSDFSSSLDLSGLELSPVAVRPAVPCPWGISKELGAPLDDVALWSSRQGPSAPEDAEDVVCKESELLALNMLLGSRERRIAVLWGPAGSGKSVLLANFCSFAAAPGRRFSAVRFASQWHHRIAFISLKDLHSSVSASPEATMVLIKRAAAGLVFDKDSMKLCSPNLSVQDRVCLVVDHAEPEYGWLDSMLPELLSSFPKLSLLLARRSPLRESELTGYRWKISDVPLSPLSAMQAASVFLKRIHRPLTESDFSVNCCLDTPLIWDQSLLFRIAAHPALEACKGNPGCIVRLAARVTQDLPSLLDVVVNGSNCVSNCAEEFHETAIEANVMVPYLQTKVSLIQQLRAIEEKHDDNFSEIEDTNTASRWLTRMRCGWSRSYKRLDSINRSPRQCISQGQPPLSTGNTLLCTGAVVACCPYNPFNEPEEVVLVHEENREYVLSDAAEISWSPSVV